MLNYLNKQIDQLVNICLVLISIITFFLLLGLWKFGEIVIWIIRLLIKLIFKGG
jgi:hypothetical protein